MPKRVAKKPENRSTETSFLVRCNDRDKRFIEAGAAAALAKLGKRGVRMPLHAYALTAAIEQAERDTGIKFEDFDT